MFKQSNRINDYIFPIALIERKLPEKSRINQVLGTAFIIGNRGYAITCSHVIEKNVLNKDKFLAGLFVHQNKWIFSKIIQYESHPTEDVAIIKLSMDQCHSFLQVVDRKEYSSLSYRMFGYPVDVAYELEKEGRCLTRPDLIYTQGYIRRRINFPILRLKGTKFYEISELAGRGCSGAPIIKFTKPIWEVIGIYAGDRVNKNENITIAYCVRSDSFADWAPEILKTTIKTESKNVEINI
jgi:hypothetical protein